MSKKTKDRSWDWGLIGFTAIVVSTLAGTVVLSWSEGPAKPSNAQDWRQPATVKVEVPNGHGSGVHIGNGFIVTAAHVVESLGEAVTVTKDGVKASARTMWSAAGYDVSLLKLDANAPLPQAVKMDCRVPFEGESINASGYPLDFGRIITRGQVASDKPMPYATWKSIVYADIAGAPGMSGGPITSAVSGKLRGIVVGGFQPVSSIMLIVPASTICGLMANGGM